MSSLVKRSQIQKLVITDAMGVEHEFEGEGVIHLRGVGTHVETVDVFLKLGNA